MGINSSTRRVTVVNDNQSGVIRISESVVQKLGQTQQLKQQQTSESQPTADESTQRSHQTITQTQPQQQQIHPNSNELVYGIPTSPTIREEYQNQIQKMEKSYKSQIDELQKQNRQLWRTANDKLSANISDVEKHLIKTKCEPICRETSKIVVDCLQSHKTQPLKCSKEVRSFVDCVHEVRKGVLNKGVDQ